MSAPAPSSGLQQRVAAAILDGAAKALAARGEQASMGDVAAASGVARATVYRYFPNRQALLDELALLALREIDDRLGSARLDEVPVQEGVTRVVRALVDVGDLFVVLARERARPEEVDRILLAPVTRLLDRGREAGDLRGDLPVQWLTETLLGTVLSVLSALPRRGREDTVAAITSLVLDGAVRRGPRPA